MKRSLLAATALLGMCGVIITPSYALADPAGSSDAEIALLKQQLRLMEQKLDSLQRQTSANASAAANANAKVQAANLKAAEVASANAAFPVKGASPISGVIVTMPNNRPTICTADNQNCISFTSRVHWDVGGYDYRPNSAATSPQRLDDGENLRRARIGVLGKFAGDWNYALIYDFGGTSDGFGGTGSVNGASVGFLPGGATGGVENAYLTYTGFKPFGGTLSIEGGINDLPYTLDEATSSNDIAFLERASSGLIATNIAANDFRSYAGARWYDDRLWVGAFATGPTTGAIHSASSTNPQGTSEQYGAVARVAGQVISAGDYTFHIGADAEFLVQPPHNLITNTQTLTLSDRPELRLDPTSLVSTGALAGVSGAQVYSAEVAGTAGPLWVQGEYFWYNVDRTFPAIAQPSLRFQGGYAQVAYALTGETRTYNKAQAAYNGIAPANPFDLNGGGWGAFEIAGRFSTINLNDQLATANGVAGGRQNVFTLAFNWYVNRNIRFMFDYLHGNIARQVSPTNFGDTGSNFDAFAMRTQVAF